MVSALDLASRGDLGRSHVTDADKCQQLGVWDTLEDVLVLRKVDAAAPDIGLALSRRAV